MTEINQIANPQQTIISKTYEHIHVERLPHIIGPTFMELGAQIESQGAQVAAAPFVSYFGITRTAGLDPQDMQVEIGFPLTGTVEPTDDFALYVRESFEAIEVTYQGDYEAGMEEVYREMIAWIQDNGKPFVGISYEFYMTGEEVPMDEQITIIQMPLELPHRSDVQPRILATASELRCRCQGSE